MRKTTGLLSVLVLGAAVAGPVASAHAAPATASAASACHRLVIKANSSNNKALSADNRHSYKKAIGHNKATQKYADQAKAACRRARHAAEIRRSLDGAQDGAQAAEHYNKRAYVEHDSRAGRAAADAERNVKARLRIALHYS
ncbi:hypothetical protein OG863_14165 [Streptomyces decoyicus]|uniref:Uncharacterized protein n=1 Tax=Streptomyces decoyicus TaxID=249567 RepID=A0ABZ1FFS6_9ACTN|nr:hypothetical protein [Streptomyces decoyicus]WSB69011.1 hypothetical protein OG863_14165 [Streptomyces decoyicus]